MPENKSQIELAAAAGEGKGTGSIVITGHPPTCRGRIDIRNISGEKVRLRELRLDKCSLRDAKNTPVTGLRVMGNLPPGERRSLPVFAAIHQSTAPGIYHARLRDVPGEPMITIEVLESWDIQLSPSCLSFKVMPGEHVHFNLRLTNTGNRPYVIRKAAFARMEEDHGLTEALARALLDAGHDGSQATLDRIARELQDFEVEPASVRITSEISRLAPGETATIQLEMRPSEKMRKNHLYHGFIRFERSALQFNLEILDKQTAAMRGKTKP